MELNNMSQVFTSQISSIIFHSDQIRSFEIKIPPDIEWDFLPGQYIDLALMDKPEEYSGFSLTSSVDEKNKISITVKRAEDGGLTEKLFRMQVGDSIMIRGPGGTFNLDLERCQEIVLIGGGIGVTPLLSMFHTAITHDKIRKLVLFHSARSIEELIFHAQLTQHSNKYSNVGYFPIVTQDPTWNGITTRISVETVLEYLKTSNFKDPCFFICGPGTLNKDFQNGLVQRGVKSDKIHTESYYEP